MSTPSIPQLKSTETAPGLLNAADKRSPWFWFVICLFPAIGTFWLIRHFGVDVPYWDEWCHLDVLIRAGEHRVTFASIIAQHNEERPFFPRLWLLFTTWFGHWNQQAQELGALGVACVTVIFLVQLAHDTCGRAVTTLVAALMGSLLIFSWVQWEAWLWGFCIDLFVPACCLFGGWVIINRNWRLPIRLIWCAALAFIAQFSFSSGTFVWCALSPVIFAGTSGSGKIRSSIGAGAFWLIAAAASSWLFFHNYIHGDDWPTLQTIWQNRVAEIEYLLAFLGYPITNTPGPLVQQEIAGAILLLAFAIALAVLFLPCNRAARLWRAMPWLMTAWFALMCAVATVMFRIRPGIVAGVAPRYAIGANPFAIATIFLLLMASREVQLRSGRRGSRIGMAVPLILATGGGVWSVFFVNSNITAEPEAAWYHRMLLHSEAALQFSKLLPDPDMVARFFWPRARTKPEFLPQVYLLNQYGYIRPRLLDEAHFAQLVKHAQRIPPGLPDVEGGFISAQREPNGDIDLSGWSWNRRTDTAAAAVIFTYRGDDQQEHPLAMALDYELGRPDVPAALGSLAQVSSGWARHLSVTEPAMKQRMMIRAWVYDPTHCQLWALPDILSLPAMSSAH